MEYEPPSKFLSDILEPPNLLQTPKETPFSRAGEKAESALQVWLQSLSVYCHLNLIWVTFKIFLTSLYLYVLENLYVLYFFFITEKYWQLQFNNGEWLFFIHISIYIYIRKLCYKTRFKYISVYCRIRSDRRGSNWKDCLSWRCWSRLSLPVRLWRKNRGS